MRMSLFFEVVMKKLRSLYRYFTPAERVLWCVSAALIVIAFAAFLVNDLYGFISWRKMERQQKIECYEP